jgi:mRNA-degrading endonuclease RelE of RelBE toxin-antitoxin system
MDVFLHEKAEKFLDMLDSKTRISIKDHLKMLSKDPYSRALDTKKLKGIGKKPYIFRLRVGNYRIIYFIQQNEILVTDIVRRETGYNF